MDLLDLLLFCTKSRVDSLVIINLVWAEWFPVRNPGQKLCTLIPPLRNPTLGLWTPRIIDGTTFIWLWMVNPNDAASFRLHNPAIIVYANHGRCPCNRPCHCRCSGRGRRCSPLSWVRIIHPWWIFVDLLFRMNPIISYVVFTAAMETSVTPIKIVHC